MPAIDVLVKIFLAGFFINLLYELLHSLLYKTCIEAPLKKYVYLIIKGAIFDGLAIALLYFVSYLVSPYYYLIIFAGITLTFAYVWEIYSLKAKKWEYTHAMPLILGAGVTPVLQLTATGFLSLYLVFHILK